MRTPCIHRNRRGEKFKILFYSLLSVTVGKISTLGKVGKGATNSNSLRGLRLLRARRGMPDSEGRVGEIIYHGDDESASSGLSTSSAIAEVPDCLRNLLRRATLRQSVR